MTGDPEAPPARRRRAVVVGGGGHARSVLDAVLATGAFEVIGVLDPRPASPRVLGLPVLGDDTVLPRLRAEGIEVAVVALGANGLRERLGRLARDLGYATPRVVHPAAFVSPSARVADGCVVLARAAVGTLVELGPFAIVNTGAVVDHDGRVGAAAHVASGATLAGGVTVGDRALLGAGAAVRPGVVIGADAVVGVGSAVVRDVAPGTVVAGAPARPLPRAGRSP